MHASSRRTWVIIKGVLFPGEYDLWACVVLEVLSPYRTCGTERCRCFTGCVCRFRACEAPMPVSPDDTCVIIKSISPDRRVEPLSLCRTTACVALQNVCCLRSCVVLERVVSRRLSRD